MDYPRLKKEIAEIADIANGVPDALKAKCFEILLNQLIRESLAPPPLQDPPPGTEGSSNQTPPGTALPVTTHLRIFMQKNGISEEEIKAVLMFADGDVHFIREPEHGKVATGQMEWALLLALKNCILNDDLSVDPEDVRSVCQDKGFYDSANFAANFKRSRYAKLFKGVMEGQGEAQALTGHGQTELAKVIRSLAAGQE